MNAQPATLVNAKTDLTRKFTKKQTTLNDARAETGGLRNLTLTTQCNETGRAQTALLPYCKESDSYVVAATTSERGTKPYWFLNLKKEPMVQLGIEGVQFYAQARTPTGRERINLLKTTRDLVPNITNKIPRETCLVVITPTW